jgi:hypothetical protein
MAYTEHTKCRACGASQLEPVFDLGNQPLANNFCRPNQPRQGFYPLKVLFCRGCGLAQLSVVVNRRVLYENYAYTTSDSITMARHFDRLFKDILSESPRKSIVEIASNNGACLKFAKKQGFTVAGIDPAKNLAAIACADGIETVADFLSPEISKGVRDGYGAPGVILARHVFAHVDNWLEFMQSIEVLCDDDTLVAIEVPYFQNLLRTVQYEVLYHEHLSTVSLKSMAVLLKKTPFRIHRVCSYGLHGGSVLIMLRLKSDKTTPDLSAEEMLHEERVTIDDWKAFSLMATNKINNLRDVVRGLRGKGHIVGAFGASAKATVMINAAGLSRQDVEFVSDNSPFKPGCLVPGTDIPVIEEGEILANHPDYLVMSAFNYEMEILAKMEKWRSRGGKFIVPDRELRIV